MSFGKRNKDGTTLVLVGADAAFEISENLKEDQLVWWFQNIEKIERIARVPYQNRHRFFKEWEEPLYGSLFNGNC
jgi:hypothetical protein